MFWQNFKRLCDKAGKSPNRVASDCGFSNAIVTGWKKGALPQERSLRKVADYFGVSISDLMAEDEELTGDDRILFDLFHSFNREGRGKLLDYAENMKRSGMYDPNVDYFLKGFDADE